MTLYAFKHNRPKVHESVFIAPTAQVIGEVRIHRNASVWFQTVIRGDMELITIGENTNIQDLTMCHADEGIPLTIGSGVTVGHRCVIHGCTIEDDCLIGMGAVVMNKAVIGRGSIVAAGAVILENTVIPPFSLVAGSPGKIKKTYSESDSALNSIRNAADIYVANARAFSEDELFFPLSSTGTGNER
ncbi:MAG TPA: gamma carbonic anhydrase family protein [Desulfobacteraceae bacterium]|nr:gamma carbonic anhydrase family protein [Desulfobacteraceae bacterium]